LSFGCIPQNFTGKPASISECPLLARFETQLQPLYSHLFLIFSVLDPIHCISIYMKEHFP